MQIFFSSEYNTVSNGEMRGNAVFIILYIYQLQFNIKKY